MFPLIGDKLLRNLFLLATICGKVDYIQPNCFKLKPCVIVGNSSPKVVNKGKGTGVPLKSKVEDVYPLKKPTFTKVCPYLLPLW
jgi:hypothetical protein